MTPANIRRLSKRAPDPSDPLSQKRFRALVPQEGADALDGSEVLLVADRPDGAPVRERLVHGEVQTRVRFFEPRPVQRATASVDRSPAAGGAAEGRVVDTVLEQQQLDTPV